MLVRGLVADSPVLQQPPKVISPPLAVKCIPSTTAITYVGGSQAGTRAACANLNNQLSCLRDEQEVQV